MTYVPITIIPDGPVTAALKRRCKGRSPKVKLGNLGPLLDDNLNAARKHGHFRYHPEDLRRLKDVDQNPEVVDEGFAVLRGLLDEKGIPEPTDYVRETPYYPDIPRLAKLTILLAAAMTIGITAAVVLGQNDAVLAMTVAITVISLLGAALFVLILARAVIHVPMPGHSEPG